ncbi:MAG: hypothetical protein L3J16_06780, partial [Anaerolineales bacterium]|nr:hypothetical protein [Anaerolineales bacterium]
MKKTYQFLLAILALIIFLVTGCAPQSSGQSALIPSISVKKATPRATEETTSRTTQTATDATPIPSTQPTLPPVSYGPHPEDFPKNINPLSGLPVSDPAQLREPALLISVPHFPASARPQAGISFAPWVFEFLIGEGTTRFLATFYGQIPYQETPIVGDCEIRNEPFVQTDLVLGNFIWLDSNANGVQDIDERGVGGVCVNLLDGAGKKIAQTSSDSNGYYGFNVSAGEQYQIEFVRPPEMTFTTQDEGNENQDSDADPRTGRTTLFTVRADERLLDAGLLPSAGATAANAVATPTFGEQVGPVRSGRLVYIPIHTFFQNSCLIYAGATWEIVDQLPRCALVYGVGDGAGGFLEIERMKRISAENARGTRSKFSYASNLFTDTPPTGGAPARQLDIFTSLMNQSKWIYDPLQQGWLRYVGSVSEEPVFTPEIDRLTGRNLVFENIILLEVKHTVLKPRIIEMSL